MLLLVRAGRTFMAGADIREFGRLSAPPTLPEGAGQDRRNGAALP
ncbi:hypothetical protein [Azospirillum sp. B510]|nr:hypothetical protein [Azospirillum sp. B510]